MVVSVIRGDENGYDSALGDVYMSAMTMPAIFNPGAHPSFHICMANLTVTWLIMQNKTGSCRKKSCALGSKEKN